MAGIPCPACNFENMAGEDRCARCFHSLMQKDIPHPKLDDSFQNAMMTTPVGALLTGKDLLVASPKDPILQIVKVLQTEEKNCVLIYEKKKLVGIISNRDLLKKAAFPSKDLSKITAAQVMTPNPECVKPEDPIAYAVNKMAMGGYRHVPVLRDDGTPVSILTIKDVLSFLTSHKLPSPL